MTDNASPAPRTDLVSRAAVILTATMFGLTYSLSAPLIALDLAQRGLSDGLIGANAAMHAVGVLITALILPRLVAKLGPRLLILGSLAASAAVLVAFSQVSAIWLFFVLRVLLGMSAEALFVLSETWINALSTEETRARAMAVYTAALSLGLALGPTILSVLGAQGPTPYLVGAGLALAAGAFILAPFVVAPAYEKPSVGNPLRFAAMAPVAIGATVLNAAVETAGLSFLALYAINLGWGEENATQLISVMMIGAIVLQLPIGWLGDKMDRHKLVIACGALATLGAMLWPLALLHPVSTYTLLFLWGGAFVGIYTLTLTIVGSRFSGGDLVGIYAVMGLTWGGGALVGPLAAGFAMQATTHGLAVFAALACGLFTVAAVLRRSA
ncbi:putative MFS family arabinose efflux permease [Azorhizobium sp. AG788]|uniref:MFS transporter n=1 Tax=Azorhizobium sp. AG788 TaxID=2183897 RepID=UPI00105E8A9B|nr:MFS transporter [Azorhizobium sp. AG788]TDT89584.1 putative MFS family arabinose efflux permease [Azorhizobium sp. AG788]